MADLRRYTGAGFVFPVLLLCANTIYLSATLNIRMMFGSEGAVGPRGLPYVACVLMYVALFIVLFQEFRKREPRGEASLKSHIRPAGVVIATAAYIFMFQNLGYAVSTLLYVGALFIIFRFELKRPLLFLFYDILVTAVFYALYAGVFSVRLPTLTGSFI
ncbi:tripartite tricarboxylate transporter TctB family protein [Martelella radicis]|uniref:Putative tricarboxylic transport membrane protein n=1 Tax=Martelella radicis TaxID=1397476 RepID=A0A7W6KHD9_9HYPH|nr:tripartite tricarboxylate transporter TctB family protein [Martelella radicis]MBB4121125.1 putative tricarboxylic transport membrane protein [Martelella radicis]